MPPRSSDEIRAGFIEFWRDKGSHLQPSSSLIPYNDPTVLLTTAGMQQFVPYMGALAAEITAVAEQAFLGSEEQQAAPAAPAAEPTTTITL